MRKSRKLARSGHGKSAAKDNRPWAIYIRVSSVGQKEEGVSLEDQELRCTEHARSKGIVVDKVYRDEGFSAKTLQRPAFQELLGMLSTGVYAGVIVTALDRLTRRLADLLVLIESSNEERWGMLSLADSIDSSTPSGRLILHILGSVAQWERETISERTTNGMAEAMRQGRYVGGPLQTGLIAVPVPGTEHANLAMCPTWGPMIQPIWGMVENGATCPDIVEYFKKNKVPCAAAGGWKPMMVHNYLTSPRVVPLLVSDEQQTRAIAAMAGRDNPHRTGGVKIAKPAKRPSVLAGVARCAACAGALVQVTAKGDKYRYLRCANKAKGTCKTKDIPLERAETTVGAALITAYQQGDWDVAINAIHAAVTGKADDQRRRLAAAIGKRDELTAAIRQAVENRHAGPAWSITVDALNSEMLTVQDDIARLQGIVDKIGVGIGPLTAVRDAIVRGIHSWERLPLVDQQRIMGVFVKSAVLGLTAEKKVSCELDVYEAAEIVGLIAEARPRLGGKATATAVQAPEVLEDGEPAEVRKNGHKGGGSGLIGIPGKTRTKRLSRTLSDPAGSYSTPWLPGEDSNLRPID